jgi:hypothetical protein
VSSSLSKFPLGPAIRPLTYTPAILSSREGLAAELSSRLEDLSQLLSTVENGLAHFLEDVSRDSTIEEEQEEFDEDGRETAAHGPVLPADSSVLMAQ